jgi:nucleoid DNA-binding protein
MIPSLIPYFIQFGQLQIPGLGKLLFVQKEAVLQDGILLAPHETIQLENNEEAPTIHFYQFLAHSLELTMDQVIKEYHQFWKDQLSQHQDFEFGTFGKFHCHNKSYQWQSQFETSNFYNNIEIGILPTISQEETMEIDIPKDRWWIGAIILFLLGILAIVFKS